MNERYALNPKSGNRKVGKIAVSTTSKHSCPVECPLRDADCYARFGPLGIYWSRLSKDKPVIGLTFTEFLQALKLLPAGSAFRHNQAGDLPMNKRGLIYYRAVKLITKAVAHLKAFTYCHYDPTKKSNFKALKYANDNGFVVNVSADSRKQADEYYNLGLPTVVTLPADSETKGLKTPNGLPIVVCPAQTTEGMDCKTCMLCAKGNRKSIVGFLAHGTANKRLTERLKEV